MQRRGAETAIEAANEATAEAFGLNDINLSSTIPSPVSDSDIGADPNTYGAVQKRLRQVLDEENLEPEDLPSLIVFMAEDFADDRDFTNVSDGELDISAQSVMKTLNGRQIIFDFGIGIPHPWY